MRGVLATLLRRGAREKVEMQKQGFIWKSGAAAMVNGLSSRPPPCMPLVLRYVHMPPPPNMPGTCICPIPTRQRHGVWGRGGSLSLTSQAAWWWVAHCATSKPASAFLWRAGYYCSFHGQSLLLVAITSMNIDLFKSGPQKSCSSSREGSSCPACFKDET